MSNMEHNHHVTVMDPEDAGAVRQLLDSRGLKNTKHLLGIYSENCILRAALGLRTLPVHKLTAQTIHERLAALQVSP